MKIKYWDEKDNQHVTILWFYFSFYQECLLPEIINPQYSRRMFLKEIKDPPHIITAKKK